MPRARPAPSPRWGEGWVLGVSNSRVCNAPPPQPRPDGASPRAWALLGPVRAATRPVPCTDALVDDVAREPAPVFVLDRADPGGHPGLHMALAPRRHPHEEPAAAAPVLVVDRRALF